MSKTRYDGVRYEGVEEARNQLPRLLDDAGRGQATVITRRGRSVAALVPLEAFGTYGGQHSLLPLAGSGRNLWSRHSTRKLRRLREEWSR
jgi:prevent-host-death family protein